MPVLQKLKIAVVVAAVAAAIVVVVASSTLLYNSLAIAIYLVCIHSTWISFDLT